PSAVLALEPILKDPHPDLNVLKYAANEYNEMHDYPKLEQALEKIANQLPDSTESWYQLSSLKALLGKPTEAVATLKRASEISAEHRKTNPAAPDVLAIARQDPKFALLKTNPEFMQLTAPK